MSGPHTANTLTVTSLQGAVDWTRAGVARRARGEGHQQGRGGCQSDLQPSYYKGQFIQSDIISI